MSLSIFSIPEEIQVDIFVKLPVKSIGISRCVCKVWCSLLRNPRFIKTHLRHTTTNHVNSRLMLTCYENKKRVLCSIDYASILSVSSALPASSATCTCHGTILRNPFPDMIDKFRILGSCDGLIFISTCGIESDNNFCIWNPSTGEYKNALLPQCYFSEESYLAGYTKYGVCFDCVSDNYKLVRISTNTNSRCYQVEVYTVDSELWNTILSNYTFDGLSIFSYRVWNGAIHCLGFKTIKEIRSKVIVSFDMTSEKFVDFMFPGEAIPVSNENLILQDYVEVLNNCLCILIYNPSIPNRIVVWKMQNYGVRESWTKLFTLTTNLITSVKYLKLLWSFASGEVLIGSDKSTFLYDPKNGGIKVFEIHGINLSAITSLNYVESLVSLNSGTYGWGEKITVNGSETKIEVKEKKVTSPL